MTSVNVLYDFCLMSALLLLAKVLRVKLKFIQRLYIPSALIAGFLGLLLGSQGLKLVPFSQEISNYSGILIAFLFGSMFLGTKKKVSFKNMIASVGDTFLVNAASEMSQFGFFIIIGIVVMPLLFKGINPAFGLMLPAGFVGGHGTAAAIGGVLGEAGWEDAKSIGQTFATIGLLGGILGGVALINWGVRHHKTAVIKEMRLLPEDMQTGLIPEDKRSSLGDVTINSMSMDVLTWHLMLILIAVGMAYLVNSGLKKLLPAVSFPVYGLALICSILLSKVLSLLKLNDFVDKRIITHMGSTSTDYLVAFGVASINLSVVKNYALPLIFLSVLGFALVVMWHFVVSPRFFKSYWYERSMYIYGMSTGVLATGVILLRILDPEFKTGVLEDFGFAWIFLSIMDSLVVSLAPMFVLSGGGVAFGLVLIAISAGCLVACKKIK